MKIFKIFYFKLNVANFRNKYAYKEFTEFLDNQNDFIRTKFNADIAPHLYDIWKPSNGYVELGG